MPGQRAGWAVQSLLPGLRPPSASQIQEIDTFSDCVSIIRLGPGVQARLRSHVAWDLGGSRQ